MPETRKVVKKAIVDKGKKVVNRINRMVNAPRADSGDDITSEAKNFIEKILGDVSKKSATKQIILGATSGWVTGLLTMRVGKAAAFAVGGGIIILQVAVHNGYLKINWDKIQKKTDKITDKVEQKVSGQGPKLMDKVVDYYRSNTFFGSGFIGGFLIGLAT